MNESCHTNDWAMAHIWMSHVTHMNVTWRTHMSRCGSISCLIMGWLQLVGSVKLQVSFAEYSLFYRALLQKRPIILSILLTEATPQHAYLFMCKIQSEQRTVGMRDVTHPYVTWLIHICDMTHLYVTWLIGIRDMTHPYVTWLIHMCDVTHPYVWWLIHMCDMTHSYVWHDSSICDMARSYVWHDSSIRDTTHSYAWHDPSMCDMTHS